MNKEYWIERFRKEREYDNMKKSTIEHDIIRLNVFLDYIGKLNKSPDTLAMDDFISFFSYLEKERKLSNNTIDKYFKLLKVFYRLMRLNHIFNDFNNYIHTEKNIMFLILNHVII